MRVSLQIVAQQTGNDELSKTDLGGLKKLATNRLGGLEGVTEYGKRYDGIVVAKIVSCEKHADADKLNVCMIDDGGVVEGVERKDGHVQVVCGAPNARAGITVAWIPPGATVPKSYDETEPFVLEKREIRGVLSNGMLASPNELGLNDDHDGILEIDEKNAEPGVAFKELYGLDDIIFDFENKMFTHRPDCFGQLGVGRELTAITGKKYEDPLWYWERANFDTSPGKTVGVFNEVDELVPRLMFVSMGGVKVGPSPIWLQSLITRLGSKPINNVVDVSNYVMHLTGQPTHAYDLDKLKGAKVGARFARAGEFVALLNGKTIELTDEDIVIADGEKALGLAGIMGGSESEVSETTTNVLLEVASFDMYRIRRSAMRHGLFTDAFTRFSKGQSPLQNDRVMRQFMLLLAELAGAAQVGEVVDLRHESIQAAFERQSVHAPVRVSPEFINARLGTALGSEEIGTILTNVNMSVSEDAGELEITAPFWRTDIELPEDIVEEVGRLYGFDRLELKLPERSIRPTPKNELNEWEDEVRRTLSAAGANEVLSYSFVHGDLLRKTGLGDVDKWAYHLRNALSPDLQYYRTSLLPSLLAKVHPNLKSDMVRSDDNECALFEIGKVHVKTHVDDDGLPVEFERLAFVFAADEKTAARKYDGSPYYMAKKYMNTLLAGQAEFKPLDTNDYPICSAYQINRSAMVYVADELLGVVGELRPAVKKALKLPNFCAGFELDLGLLMSKLEPSGYQPIGTFPKSQQDITFALASDKTYSQLRTVIWDELMQARSAHGYEFTLGPRDIFQKDGAERTNFTFRIWAHHPHKTLKTEEVNALLERVAAEAKQKLKAERVT
jgi:phenylalanyl-tRNA synthetase beta chain